MVAHGSFWLLTAAAVLLSSASPSFILKGSHETSLEIWRAVRHVLEGSQPDGTIITITDNTLSSTIPKDGLLEVRRGAAVVEAVVEEDQQSNSTTGHLDPLVGVARQVRRSSWETTVVVVSDDPAFLAAMGKSALRSRLLVWSTRLLAVTRLPLPQLQRLLADHWSFSMMNTVVMNLEDSTDPLRYGLYVHLPYSPGGAQVVRVATWTPEGGLLLVSGLPLFPEKFSNFYGARVNVTALPFPPYWNVVEEADPSNATVTRYSGTDYLMLEAIAHALNFTINVLPTANWGEVTERVEERHSFVATVIYAVFPQRLEHYDYSYMFEYAFHAFSMARPALKPHWQSLYYPLADRVWASILVVLCLLPLPFILVRRIRRNQDTGGTHRSRAVFLEIFGTLLGQELSRNMSHDSSDRLLMATWLVFAFIVGTAYRGNLTASLTAPKYPARVETLRELVGARARVTMPPYGAQFRDFFEQSESADFKKLGERVDIVPTAVDGLGQTITKKQAHMEARRYLELMIAEKFTRADGSSELYVARESVFPGLSAWPVPHDAPYKHTLDRCIMAVMEGGLYEKWSSDLLSEARKESRMRQRQHQQQQQQQQARLGVATEDTYSLDSIAKALTIIHMQGPLLLLLFGLILASFSFAFEILASRCLPSKK